MKWFFKRIGYHIALFWFDLSKIDRGGIIVLAVMILACSITAVSVYKRGQEKAVDEWRYPERVLPDTGEEVVGIYAEYDIQRTDKTVAYKAELVRVELVYLPCYEERDGQRVFVEYWVHDDGTGGAGPDIGRPICWAPSYLAKRLPDPEVPDLLRKAFARRQAP